MTTLAADSPRTYAAGDFEDYPVIDADIIYQGAAVGENGAGYARPLEGGDRFLGFALSPADNSAGAAGAKTVRTQITGKIQLSVTGLVITDVGQPVYAQDDDTFSFSPVSGSYIGAVERYVSDGVGIVAFDAINGIDPWGGYTAEAVSDNKTLDEQDTGKVFVVDADAKAITLPAVAGMNFAIVNGGADGTILVTISPNANDGIAFKDAASTDNKDLLNTKITARRGDFVELEAGDATGWYVSRSLGIWEKEA